MATRNGWVKLGVDDTIVDVVGVDRHGRPDVRCLLVQSKGDCQAHYLGSEGSFVQGGPRTRVLAMSGEPYSLRRLVDEAIQELSFEVDVHLSLADPHCSAARYWDALAGYVGTPSTALELGLRRADPSVPRTTLHIARQDVVAGFQQAWPQEVLRSAHAVLVGEQYLLDRRGFALATWISSAIAIAHGGQRYAFDSLQHTATIAITPQVRDPGSRRGLCAFRTPETVREVHVEWDDPRWSPLIGGMALVSDQS